MCLFRLAFSSGLPLTSLRAASAYKSDAADYTVSSLLQNRFSFLSALYCSSVLLHARVTQVPRVLSRLRAAEKPAGMVLLTRLIFFNNGGLTWAFAREKSEAVQQCLALSSS